MAKAGKSISGKNQLAQIIIATFFFVSITGIHDAKTIALERGSPLVLDSGNYVIAGVFRFFENAVHFSEILFARGYESRYGYYPTKGYFYVYLNKFDAYDQAKASCLKLRKFRELKDAWVMSIPGHSGTVAIPALRDEYFEMRHSQLPEDNSPNDEYQKMEVRTTAVTSIEEKTSLEGNGSGTKNYKLYCSVYDIRNHSELDAKIEIIDSEKLSPISMIDANTYQELENYRAANQMLLISHRFGFRKVERLIDPDLVPVAGSGAYRKGDTLFVDFELVRLKAGDIQIMYNVYFYNNAAVMKPESRYEVDQLLAMLEENPNYKIMIHGHTNGNSYGPIIKMREDDTNFFQLANNNRESKGSARELSKERASAIYQYLVSRGIKPDRMKIQGWGGKKMLYPASHDFAKQNARVEIEILDD